MSDSFDQNEIEECLEIMRTQESVPSHVVYKIINEENLIKTWREYREISQEELANTVKVPLGHLLELESGTSTPSKQIIGDLAKALSLDIDDLEGI